MPNRPSLSEQRSQALLQAMQLQQHRPNQQQDQLGGANDPRLTALAYGLRLLGESRSVLPSAGTLTDLLETNGVSFREVRTPHDLVSSSRALMLVLAEEDGRPMVVHRQGGQALIFDPIDPSSPWPLRQQPACKPFAYEIYAAWPQGLNSLPKLLQFSLNQHITPLLAVLVSALVVALFNLCIPTLTSFLVGTVLPLGQLQLIAETSLAVLLIAASTVVAQLFSNLALVRLESLVNLRVETALFSHLLRLPLQFFSNLGTADLITRIAAIRQMRQLLSNGLMSAALGLLFSLSNLVLMVTYQAQLALVAGSFSAISALVMALLVWQNARLERPLQEGQAQVSNLGLQAVNGMAQIRVGGNEPFVFERWFRDVARLARLQRQGEGYSNALEILARLLNPLGQVVIFAAFMMMLQQAQQGAASGTPQAPDSLGSLGANALVAAFVSFQAAYLSFNSQLSTLATQVASSVARLIVLWQRSEVVMYATPEPGAAVAGEPHQVEGRFSLQKLQVSYPGKSEPVLRDITLEIPNGSYTAFTGPSGCGKTTLLRCLLRLIEPELGAISVDGVDLRKLGVRAYRRQLGVVLQNTPLPSGSIYEIVRAGRPFSRDEVWQALAQAAIADDVSAMGMQLETLISEGAGAISGGQRQRIALARALIGQPKVLLLDEATSALDAPTQAAITQTLESLKITRIAIAHRLSTIESADQIAVIQEGRICELGTFTELTESAKGYLTRGQN